MSNDIRVLNLYAGIGGNRKNWSNVDVIAVEWDDDKAEIYSDHFPDDKVVVTDAHEYLRENYSEFDFIWASPPCPTHSQARKMMTGENKQNDPVYPDMGLYEEILFLKGYFQGDWVVENVNGWYEPLIEPYERQRHYLWSNFYIPEIELPASNIRNGSIEELESSLGYDLSGYELSHSKKQKMLRNCVEPELGAHVLEAATNDRQTALEGFA